MEQHVRHANRDPRLAYPASSDNRYETTGSCKGCELLCSALPTDEGRELRRQICVVEAAQRWEIALSQLEQPLGRRKIFQPVATKLPESNVYQASGRIRDNHLAAMGCRTDPSRLVHVETDVAFFGGIRLASMDANSHPDQAFPHGILCRCCGGDCAGRAWKRVEECIALRVDFGTAMSTEGLTDPISMSSQLLRVPSPQLSQEASGPLDIREH